MHKAHTKVAHAWRGMQLDNAQPTHTDKVLLLDTRGVPSRSTRSCSSTSTKLDSESTEDS